MKGKGLGTLIDASEACGLLELHGYLLSSPSVVYVHSECRKYFIDLRKIKRHKPEDAATSLRGLRSKGILNWKHVCFLCGEHANSHDADIHAVHTLEIRDSLLRCCADVLMNGCAGFWLVALVQ